MYIIQLSELLENYNRLSVCSTECNIIQLSELLENYNIQKLNVSKLKIIQLSELLENYNTFITTTSLQGLYNYLNC